MAVPIKKNKAFFFFLYEGQRVVQRSIVTTPVLTAPMRAGIFRYFPGVVNGNATSNITTGANPQAPVVDLLGNPVRPAAATGDLMSVSLYGKIRCGRRLTPLDVSARSWQVAATELLLEPDDDESRRWIERRRLSVRPSLTLASMAQAGMVLTSSGTRSICDSITISTPGTSSSCGHEGTCADRRKSSALPGWSNSEASFFGPRRSIRVLSCRRFADDAQRGSFRLQARETSDRGSVHQSL